MPELPEVETVCRGLAGVLEGRRLAKVELRRKDLRIPFPKGLVAAVTGQRIERIYRRAKYVMLHLGSNDVLIAHLGMAGRMTIIKEDAGPPGPHDHVIFTTDDGTVVRFNDPRRFGLMTLAPAKDLDTHKLFRHLGPDAMSDYACESLFRAGISPKRKAGSVAGKRAEALVPVIKQVLAEAIAAGGSSLRDHVQPSGELGYFQKAWQVYGREGESCGCGSNSAPVGHTVKRIVQGGRSTFFCTHRQT